MTDLRVFSKDIPETYFLFPIRIVCKIPSFTIANDVQICEMDERMKANLLRIQSTKYDDEGNLIGFKPLPGCPLQNSLETPFAFPFLDLTAELCSSNYVVQVPSCEKAQEVNLTFKLIAPASPSLYIGYSNDGKSGNVINPPSYFGKSALIATTDTVAELSKLLGAVMNHRGDAKFRLMTDKYLYATSFGLRDENRFLEMAIILEMLLLPKNQQELSYRFSLRLAKLAAAHTGENIQDAFKTAKQIYVIRSNLAHSGRDSDVGRMLPRALDYVRQMLCLYLDSQDSFTQEALDNLCLK
jgi:hypothetical protein